LEKARKARRNKNFDLIQEVTGLWEEARRHDVGADKRSKLVSAILGKVQGRIAELAGSHSASRIIQTCAKHGTPAGGKTR
jgi:pumilio family protein 6